MLSPEGLCLIYAHHPGKSSRYFLMISSCWLLQKTPSCLRMSPDLFLSKSFNKNGNQLSVVFLDKIQFPVLLAHRSPPTRGQCDQMSIGISHVYSEFMPNPTSILSLSSSYVAPSSPSTPRIASPEIYPKGGPLPHLKIYPNRRRYPEAGGRREDEVDLGSETSGNRQTGSPISWPEAPLCPQSDAG